MSSLIPMHFDGRAVRVVEVAGEPWFVGKDVCEALGYADPTTAMRSHCRGVQKLHPIIDALGRRQETRILSEPDVLRLIVNSKLPEAERFERWVFEEVLPTIRKTGSYSAKARNGLAEFRKARALELSARTADMICGRFPHLSTEARQVIFAYCVNPVAGADVVPLPVLERKFYTAEQVGQELGVSANRIGRVANEHGLKTTEYGMFVLDKARFSDKQVEAFRYNVAGIERLRELLKSEAIAEAK